MRNPKDNIINCSCQQIPFLLKIENKSWHLARNMVNYEISNTNNPFDEDRTTIEIDFYERYICFI